jgi:hypothetical protein
LDGTSHAVRENMVDILTRELLGPSEGEEEVLTTRPDERYLLGRIAPVKLLRGKGKPRTVDTGSAPAPIDDQEQEGAAELGDELDADLGRGVPMLAVDESTGDADEDTGGDRDDEPVKRGLMIPASMGLRFQVPGDLGTFYVAASWGVYNPKRTGEVTASGRQVRVFARTPVHHRIAVHTADLTPGETRDYPLQDHVTLRVDCLRYTPSGGQGRLLVEVALCNDRETPRSIPLNAWMFQTQLHVDAGGADAFLPVRDALDDTAVESDAELRRLRLQYRDRLEFAVGRTCSADWTRPPGAPDAPNPRRAVGVRTTWLPTAQVPQIAADDIPGVELDMTVLARADAVTLERTLRPIVNGYGTWLDDRLTQARNLPEHLRTDGLELVDEARAVHAQLAAGLDYLVHPDNVEVRRCFAFMNRVMADQRIHTQIADERVKNPDLDIPEARAAVLAKHHPHHWRTFQLAFVLMQIEALCVPDLPRRSGDIANVELLFFPTGGGKTEAYLGLAAFTFAIRRRQGVVDSTDGPLDGRTGVAVLMRYTLRLLTAQQFQRATALVCAAELARREAPELWGTETFRIGLWVGSGVSPKYVKDAAEELERFNNHRSSAHRVTVLQIQRCPWCGTRVTPADVTVDDVEGRVHVRCGDDLADCPFASGGQVSEGLPVLTVDEEIYRLAPAFVIATVDKFARLAREGEAAALFGYVAARCDRHGYVHPDSTGCRIQPGSRHPGGSAMLRPTGRLRPPDLIIQDELHLITGALGTTAGLFEVAVDVLAAWRTPRGGSVQPLVVASSATIRNAADQVRALYGRGVTVFPPQVLDAGRTFFSRELPVTAATPGRQYIGVSTTGVRVTTAQIQIAVVLMAAAQELLDQGLEQLGAGARAADPYLTLVGYFSATRELAGMARYLQDDVQSMLALGRPGSRLARRSGTHYGALRYEELTSRVASSQITRTLDEMAAAFDDDFDSTVGRRALAAARAAHRPVRGRETNPFDAILATSMLQVGVDVTRLGLMMLVGQPKNTAEYIQASSRVGRDANRPGLVVTLGNWARPRDLAHYEAFRHYHDTFYGQVEPLSVTPFSVTSLERGLDGVLVSAARVLQAGSTTGLSPERGAGRVVDQLSAVEALIDRLVERIRAASDEESAELAHTRLRNRLDLWCSRRTKLLAQQANLSYEKEFDTVKGGRYRPLMRSAESVASRDDALVDAPFVIANSMREVQPEINILVSPKPERMFFFTPPTVPGWTAQDAKD